MSRGRDVVGDEVVMICEANARARTRTGMRDPVKWEPSRSAAFRALYMRGGTANMPVDVRQCANAKKRHAKTTPTAAPHYSLNGGAALRSASRSLAAMNTNRKSTAVSRPCLTWCHRPAQLMVGV